MSTKTKVILSESDFWEIVSDKLKEAQGSDLSGWRLPIYCDIAEIFEEGEELTPEIYGGGWLSGGSYQPDAFEVLSVEPWSCADWEEGGWDSEEDYDKDMQIEAEIDEFRENWDWKTVIKQEIKNWLETIELTNPVVFIWS